MSEELLGTNGEVNQQANRGKLVKMQPCLSLPMRQPTHQHSTLVMSSNCACKNNACMAYTHTYTQIHTHTYRHTYKGTYIQTYVYAWNYTYVRTHICKLCHKYILRNLQVVGRQVLVDVNLHTYMHLYIHAHTHTHTRI